LYRLTGEVVNFTQLCILLVECGLYGPSYSPVILATTHFTCVTHLKALYAEEAEVLVQFTPCLLRLAKVLFQIYLHLLSAAKKEEMHDTSSSKLIVTKAN